MTVPGKIMALHEMLAALSEGIAACFIRPVRVTIVVRDPSRPDGRSNMLFTDDDQAEILKAIQQTNDTEFKTFGGPNG